MNPLEQILLKALRAAEFEKVLDYGPVEGISKPEKGVFTTPSPISFTPNIDLAVFRLGKEGQLLETANVILSPEFPEGRVVRPGGINWKPDINFISWDKNRWIGSFLTENPLEQGHKPPVNFYPPRFQEEVLAGAEGNRDFFLSPYPASNFKLLVAFYIMRLIDQGEMDLEDFYFYRPPGGIPEGRKLRDWLFAMVAFSDNSSTKALFQNLGTLNRLDELTGEFQKLGLNSLILRGIDPETGYHWRPGNFNMTAFDTARLLWLIEGGPGELWEGAGGKPIHSRELSSSRAFLKSLLADQALHEALSTGSLGDLPGVEQGIPARVPEKWIDPLAGKIGLPEVGLFFETDVRPRNARAEVTFAHKTGLTYNFASDAGIVKSLPGYPFRYYIISFFSTLGYRFVDPYFSFQVPGDGVDRPTPVRYTQRIARLGKMVDDWMKEN